MKITWNTNIISVGILTRVTLSVRLLYANEIKKKKTI